jgi:hypothetical protein
LSNAVFIKGFIPCPHLPGFQDLRKHDGMVTRYVLHASELSRRAQSSEEPPFSPSYQCQPKAMSLLF